MLPCTDGTERELREFQGDGEVVVRDGHDNVITVFYQPCFAGDGWPWASNDGRYFSGEGKIAQGLGTDRDIVQILGPAEKVNDDGTVTKVCSIPVTLHQRDWNTHEPVAYKIMRRGEVTPNGRLEPLVVNVLDGEWGLILRPKTPSEPPYAERLARAVAEGTVVLPIGNGLLSWSGLSCDCCKTCVVEGPDGNARWDPTLLGPLPEWKEGDPLKTEVAPIRERAEQIKREMSDG